MMNHNTTPRRTPARVASRAAAPALAFAALGALLAACPAAAHAQVRAARPAAPVAPARRFTLSFHNADATDVLRAVALQTGVSVAASPSVKGRTISVRLRDVTAEEALQVVAQAAGLTYRRGAGNTYVVGTEEELKNARVASADSTGVYTPRHLSVAGAETLLGGALPDVSVRPIAGSGSVLLVGSRADVARAQALLAATDVPSVPVAEVITPRTITARFLGDVLRQAVPDVLRRGAREHPDPVRAREAVARALALAPAVDTPGGAAQRVEVYRIRYSSAAALTAMLTAALPGLQVTPSGEPYAPLPAVFQPLTSSGAFGGGAGRRRRGRRLRCGGGPRSRAGRDRRRAGAPYRQVAAARAGRPGAQIAQALQLLAKVDVAPAQVTIEARIVDLTGNYDRDLGIPVGRPADRAGSRRAAGTRHHAGLDRRFRQRAERPSSSGSARSSARRSTSPRSSTSWRAAGAARPSRTRGSVWWTTRTPTSSSGTSSASRPGRQLRHRRATRSACRRSRSASRCWCGPASTLRGHHGQVHPVVSHVHRRVSKAPADRVPRGDTTLRVRSGDTIAIGGLIREVTSRPSSRCRSWATCRCSASCSSGAPTARSGSEVVLF
jgi:hypothetical protein